MNIAFVASEAFPYAKTGGLADVAGALPKALENQGCNVKLFMPKYGTIDEKKFALTFIKEIKIPVQVAGETRMVFLHRSVLPGSNVEVNFIDCPHYFFRKSIYTNDPDEDERFILFNKAVLELIKLSNWVPDIIHCNDWQSGLVSFYLKENYKTNNKFSRTATLFTIHNVGYQGHFSEETYYKAEINRDLVLPFDPDRSSDFSFMKNAVMYSDMINTVSQTYALEILSPEYGSGMDKILNERKTDLFGIVNGIDYSEWDPLIDEYIPYHFNFDNLEGKRRNKKYLLEKFNLNYGETIPLIGIVSRLAGQKGFDIVAESINELMSLDLQWIILGSGEDRYENLFRSLAHSFPDKVGSHIGYSNDLSHLIEAGSDLFLMPSRYEPCGLNQIYSLRYGTVPVVRRTGGLADTVRDWHEFNSLGNESGTGFSFNDYTSMALVSTVSRAVETFKEKELWKKIQKNGMALDYSWEHSANDYLALYKKALTKKM
jgi:starch synthase